jgi:hypothetical protein
MTAGFSAKTLCEMRPRKIHERESTMKTALRLSWVPFALALIGCGGHGSTSPASQGRLDGDVFIVTQGAENVKLGLVEVRVLPYGETRNSVAKTKAQAEREVANLQPQLDAARKALASAQSRTAMR